MQFNAIDAERVKVARGLTCSIVVGRSSPCSSLRRRDDIGGLALGIGVGVLSGSSSFKFGVRRQRMSKSLRASHR